ncbi:hypothetical protein Tco_0172096, partial [Tanacetum coccineum]
MLEDISCNAKGKRTEAYTILVLELKTLNVLKSTCFVRDLQGNDLLTSSRGSDLYTMSLQETTSSTPICFMA